MGMDTRHVCMCQVQGFGIIPNSEKYMAPGNDYTNFKHNIQPSVHMISQPRNNIGWKPGKCTLNAIACSKQCYDQEKPSF
jgi:hypothetical protein